MARDPHEFYEDFKARVTEAREGDNSRDGKRFYSNLLSANESDHKADCKECDH